MATTTPVTTSGFYEESAGGYRYYWWQAGTLHSGAHTFATLGTARLVKTVEDLGYCNDPYYLHELGYRQAEIERAVAQGELTWLHDGRLNPTHGTRA